MHITLSLDTKRLKWLAIGLVAGVATAVPAGIYAGGAVPHTFAPGEVVSAAKFNANFQNLADRIEIAGGIGDVVASMLPEATFLATRGNGWVLADGRDVTGSTYASVSGLASVPDLRGVFLRGKNYARDTSAGNAAGDLSLGAFQTDSFKRHRHRMRLTLSGGSGGAVDVPQDNGGRSKDQAIDETGGDETAPRNITVNYFIRVN